MLVQAAVTGGKIMTRPKYITAAIAPVMTKVTTVTHIIRPERARSLVPATAPAIDAKTIGTTIQNIMRMKIVPRNAILDENSG